MAWFRAGGGGIPSSLKSDMNDVFNKKFGTTLQDYPPDEWPGTVNLMGPLPEKTVSGSVVTFSDGADDVPLKSCEVTIAPTLDGVTSVDVVSAGKNLFDAWAKGYGINTTTGEIQNNNNGAISGYIPVKENTDYYISGLTNTLRSFIAYYKSDRTFISKTNGNDKLFLAFTTPAECAFIIVYQYVVSSSTGTIDDIDNLQTQVEYGTQGTTYTPYTAPTTHTANLGRTIYGGSADVVNGTGTDEYTFDLWDGTQNYNVSDNLTNVFRIYMAHAKPLPDVTAVQCICDGYTFPRAGWNSDTVSFYSDANNFTLKLPKTEVTTIEQAKAWLAQHNVTFLYATTPETFTFTPVPINSRLGDNTMWSDGDLSVTYRRDIDLALAQ